MTASFETFMDTAWRDHGDDPAGVASRLADARALPQDDAERGRLASLATHVYGEHLGRWMDGVAFLDTLRRVTADDARDAEDASGDGDGRDALTLAIDRHVATLRHAAGDTRALDGLAPAEAAAALAGCASAMAGRGDFAHAIADYAAARELASAGLADGSPAIRALAVGGNNLAVALEGKPDRTPAETAAMVDAAHSALVHWRRAGTWLEEERAHYRLAMSRLAADDAAGAIDSATHCLAVCDANEAPPFERFFGYAALAMARRAAGERTGFDDARTRALALYESLPDDDKPFARGDLAKIEAS
jgi:hypothetical protein